METSTIFIILGVAALIVAAFFLGMVSVRRLYLKEPPIGDLVMAQDDYDGHVYFFLELDSNVIGVDPANYISARKTVQLNVSSQKNQHL